MLRMNCLKSSLIVLGVYIALLVLVLHSQPRSQANSQEIDLPICNKSSNFFVLNASSSYIQNFSSPNYPKVYPSYSSCTWIIGAAMGQLVKLTFSAFSIYSPSSSDSKQCPYAYVKVTEEGLEGSEYIVGRFCGNAKPQTIYSSGGQLRVEFKNTFRIVAEGFVAKYTAIQPGTACSPSNTIDENSNILLHAPMGRIASPRFPNSYSSIIDCTWKITLPVNKAINFTFDSFTRVSRAICSDSSLEVYNSRYGHGHGAQLGLFCGEMVPPVIYSSGCHLSLRLKAVEPRKTLSFIGRFHSLSQVVNGSCDDTAGPNTIKIAATAGSLFTPNYPQEYPSNKECTWFISVPSGHNVRLVFYAFDLSSDVACSDAVELRDGKSLTNPVKSTFCGSQIPQALIMTSNLMTVRFKSNYDGNRRGFLAMFETTSEKPQVKTTPRIQPGVCSASYDPSVNNNLQVSGQTGTIKSPNYPAQYPNSISCTWVISVKDGNRVKLSFSDFWIDDQHGCYGDYIEIRDGSSGSSPMLGQRYCGNKGPGDTFSSGAQMRLQFISDDSATGQGFKATFSSVSKPFNRFIVVGIAIGAIVILLILIFIYCKIKKKREKDLHDDSHSEDPDLELHEVHQSHGPVNPLLNNKSEISNNGAPRHDAEVTYAPKDQNGDSEQLTTDAPPNEYAWFKPKKRRSKGIE